jgi:hypothetical protein
MVNVDDYRNDVKDRMADRDKNGSMNAASETREPEYAVCKTCTILLVKLCYERVWWFRWLREPLLLGMRLLSRRYGIDPRDYPVRTETCYGCIRFMKESLKEKSMVARRLNDLINPVFNRIRDSIVTEEEIREARRFAREATRPEVASASAVSGTSQGPA